MPRQRTKKKSKASKKKVKKTPKPNVEVIHLRSKDQRVKMWLNQVQTNNVVEKRRKNGSFLKTNYNASAVKEAVEIFDNGLDDSGDDGESICSSIISGPSFLYQAPVLEPEPYWDYCSPCEKLFEQTKKGTIPAKDKHLDTADPQSLACDQWVLKKKWKSGGLSNARRTRVLDLNFLRRKRPREIVSPICSRPHVFLKRNLKKCIKAQTKKKRKNKPKKATNSSKNDSVIKQQHPRNNNHFQMSAIMEVKSPIITKPTSFSFSETPQSVQRKDANRTKTSAFNDLLAQLRGSIIVKENR